MGYFKVSGGTLNMLTLSSECHINTRSSVFHDDYPMRPVIFKARFDGGRSPRAQSKGPNPWCCRNNWFLPELSRPSTTAPPHGIFGWLNPQTFQDSDHASYQAAPPGGSSSALAAAACCRRRCELCATDFRHHGPRSQNGPRTTTNGKPGAVKRQNMSKYFRGDKIFRKKSVAMRQPTTQDFIFFPSFTLCTDTALCHTGGFAW